jgi:hypothetical protein
VSNTESDVFRLGAKGAVYYLVSGRWFTAADFNGPWTFATPDLPDDFKKIPISHKRSRVLASVPGTDQAAEAVLLAQIPETARIEKKLVKAPEVQYEGDPQFQPIETTVARATKPMATSSRSAIFITCARRRLFMSRSPNGLRDTGTRSDLRDPGELAGVQRHQRHRRRGQQRRGRVRDRGRLHRNDGGVGLRGLGHRLLLPAVRLLRRLLSGLSPVLPDVRLPRVV